MAKPFDELRERLLRAGVAPRHVRRYLAELADHLADLRAEEERAGRSRADAESEALARLGGMDDLARAMIEQRHFRAWCVRAPWAVLGAGPLLLLAGTWFVALLILWSGWQIFLPGAATPFGVRPGPHHIFELVNIYFQIDRMIYFGAPFVIGWGISLIAARQRLKMFWPTAGLVLTSLLAGTAQVHANRPVVPGGAGRVGMDFALGPLVHGIPDGLLHALVILTVTALPYLAWRLQRACSLSA